MGKLLSSGRRRVALGLFTGVVSFALLAACVPTKPGPTATFDSTPAAGPAGSSITVSSITPCPPLPAGVQGPPIVRVNLVQGGQEVGSVELPVDASGAWSGALVVAGSASPGGATLDAFCFSSTQAEGTTLTYQSRTFTVTS